MLKKRIKYKDWDGNQRVEDFWFGFSEVEVLEMEANEKGGMEGLLKRIVSTQDRGEMVKLFSDLILNSYGEKSADGREFYKDDTIKRHFKATNAYNVLFQEITSSDQAAADFINGIFPDDLDTSGAENSDEYKRTMAELKELAGIDESPNLSVVK